MAIGPNITSIELTQSEKEIADMLEREIDAVILRNSATLNPLGYFIEADRRINMSEHVQLEIAIRYRRAGWADVVWWPYNQHDGYLVQLFRKPEA